MTETMRTTLRICARHSLGTACPICGEDPGFYVNGAPFCINCTSQYANANVLGEGPNKSKLPPQLWPFIKRCLLRASAITIGLLTAFILVYWLGVLVVCTLVLGTVYAVVSLIVGDR